VGGGSVELIASRGEVEWTASEKLGVLRLTEDAVRSDPLSSSDEARLVRRVSEGLGRHVERAREAGVTRVVGTSGTILALGTLAHELATGHPPERVHHLTVSAAAIRALRERLVAMDLRARLKLPGLDALRADIIVAGAVLLDEVLSRLGAAEIILCEWALREGVLIDYIESHRTSLVRAARLPDPRRRSVLQLAERCRHDDKHARHVARLAVALFDATHERHRFGASERDLLEYAALLHDVGHHISYPAHHKHSYYLIKHGDLHGFSPNELEVVACAARYHRRRRPRKSHAAYAALPRRLRRAVRVLAAILRLADALDRSHRQIVESVRATLRGDTLRLVGEATGDCELERWGASQRVGPLQRVLGCEVEIRIAAAVKRRKLAR